MIFESKREYDDLIGDVTEALQTLRPKDEQGVGGELPPEATKVPSDGHSDSTKDPNVSSKNQPKHDGPFIEDLEDRLCLILQEMAKESSEFDIGAVGRAGVLGTASDNANTKAGAARAATGSYAIGKTAKDEEDEKDEEGDITDQLKAVVSPEEAKQAEKVKREGEELAGRDEVEPTTPGPV